MKKATKINLTLLALVLSANGLYAQQGFGTNQPSKAAVIDLQSESKGLLIPRVALTSLSVFLPIKGETATNVGKTNSLLVYNTATVNPTIKPGYYYWTTDGTSGNSFWKRLLASDDATALTLAGDVTGTLGAAKVEKIQGRNVSAVAPVNNQVLTWNTADNEWKPVAITPAQISNAANVTAGSNKVTLGDTPIGASLQPFSIDVVEGNLTLSNIGGKVTNNQITAGTNGQILITNGTTTGWVDQSTLTPTTTNDLSSSGNTLISNVNGISDNATIINANTLVLTGNNLVSTVNGVATTPAVDLSKYLDNTDNQTITDFSVTGANLSITLERGNTMIVPLSSVDTDNQTITDLSLSGTTLSITLERGNTRTLNLSSLTNSTHLANGANTTVSGTGTSTDQYTVNVATATNTGNLGVVKQAASNPSVTINANGELAVDPSKVSITNLLNSSNNTMSSTVNGGTAQTAPIINSNILALNGSNQLISTVNGVATTPAVDLSPAIKASETVTTITQDLQAGTLTYDNESTATPTAYNIHWKLNSNNTGLSTNNNVASGAYATALGGGMISGTPLPNTASGDYSAVLGGINNKVEGIGGSVVGGTDNVVVGANTQYAAVLSGSNNRAEGNYSVVIGGSHNIAKSLYETVLGQAGTEYTPSGNLSLNRLFNIGNGTAASSRSDAFTILKNGKVGVGFNNFENTTTFDQKLQVNGNARITGLPAVNGIATDKAVVVDADGVLKTVKTAPRFFYMPAVIFDTSVTANNLQRDLYQDYVKQFTGGLTGAGNANYNIAHGAGGYSMNYTGGIIGSTGAPADISVYGSGELYYYITYYDTAVFAGASGSGAPTITADGKLNYSIIGTASPTSYMNIVFVVRESN